MASSIQDTLSRSAGTMAQAVCHDLTLRMRGDVATRWNATLDDMLDALGELTRIQRQATTATEALPVDDDELSTRVAEALMNRRSPLLQRDAFHVAPYVFPPQEAAGLLLRGIPQDTRIRAFGLEKALRNVSLAGATAGIVRDGLHDLLLAPHYWREVRAIGALALIGRPELGRDVIVPMARAQFGDVRAGLFMGAVYFGNAYRWHKPTESLPALLDVAQSVADTVKWSFSEWPPEVAAAKRLCDQLQAPVESIAHWDGLDLDEQRDQLRLLAGEFEGVQVDVLEALLPMATDLDADELEHVARCAMSNVLTGDFDVKAARAAIDVVAAAGDQLLLGEILACVPGVFDRYAMRHQIDPAPVLSIASDSSAHLADRVGALSALDHMARTRPHVFELQGLNELEF